jgi:putative salt-induced outer membrane protein YdiY
MVTLHLRNGAQLSGEMLSMDSTFLTITNALLGKVAVPVAEVQRLEKTPAAGSPPVVTNQPPVTVAAQASPTNQPPAQTAKPTPQTATTAKAAESKTPGPQPAPVKPKPPKHWNLTLDVGTDLEFNQTHRELYYGHAKWTYGKDRFRSIVDYLANYGKTDGILSANDMNGSVRLELDVSKSKRSFMFDAAGAGYNQIQQIDATYDDTFGTGYKLITRSNFTFNVSLGANYQKKYLKDGSAPDYKAINLGEQLAWKINPKWSLDQKVDYYQRITGIGDYRLRFESNVRYLLSNNINLSLTAVDQYDTQPAPGVSKNDLLLRVALGVKF